MTDRLFPEPGRKELRSGSYSVPAMGRRRLRYRVAWNYDLCAVAAAFVARRPASLRRRMRDARVVDGRGGLVRVNTLHRTLYSPGRSYPWMRPVRYRRPLVNLPE